MLRQKQFKKTIALSFNGEIKYFGIICAGKALNKKTKTVLDVKCAVNEIKKQNEIKFQVLNRILKGENVVYGRFYINERSIKSHLTIATPSHLMIKQIFPVK